MEATLDSPAPVQEKQRIVIIDILRGFAILGLPIIHVNLSYGYVLDMGQPLAWGEGPLGDVLVIKGIQFFLHLKMMAIFAMLFGVGFALQERSARHAQRPFGGRYAWRQMLLLAIGLFHGIFLWYGDILSLYAVCGVILLLCRNLKIRTLLTLAGVLSLVPIVTILTPALFTDDEAFQEPSFEHLADHAEQEMADLEARIEAVKAGTTFPAESDVHSSGEQESRGDVVATTQPSSANVQMWESELQGMKITHRVFHFLASEEEVYQRGTVFEQILHRSVFYLFIMTAINAMLMFWRSLALMLLGAALLQYGLFDRPWEHRTLLRRVLVFGLIFGLLLVAVREVILIGYGQTAWGVLGADVIQHFGSLAQGLAYAAGIVLICLSEKGIAWLKPLASVGRTALTNYLGQSVLAGLIFYSYGLGLFERLNHVQATLVALGMMALQLTMSYCWCSVFRFGPVEWLWRCGTYLKIQPMLKR